MEHWGVPFAVTLSGELADAESVTDGDRQYRCLECGAYVHLRKGPRMRAHFAHYPGEGGGCSRESIEHEAAKRRLKELLDAGQRRFSLKVPCHGHVDTEGKEVSCPGKRFTELRMSVPVFDEVRVEVQLARNVLDVAALLGARVVMGLEVHVTHEVDEGKCAALMESHLPWFEVSAYEVLHKNAPWEAISSSFGPVQCQTCALDLAEAERLR